MKRLNSGIARVLQGVLTLLLLVLLVPVCMQILSRFTTIVPRYIWTEEIARYAFVWIVMIGSMIAVRDETHFDLDILPQPRTARGRAIGKAFRHLAVLAVALIFLWFGIEFTQVGHDQESELLSLDMAWVHGAWPVAGAVYTLFTLEKLWDDLAPFRGGARPGQEVR